MYEVLSYCVTERDKLRAEHHAEAEALHLAAAERAVVEGLDVGDGGAWDGHAVVELGVELPRLHVHCAVEVHGAREDLQELNLAVAVRGVEVRDDFIPNALRVL